MRCVDSVNVPVGTPIPDTQVLILDEHDRHSHNGDVGEVVIVSDWLAHGYLDRDATDSSFYYVDHNGESKRAYRTGDLGRWLSSGDLELMGRKDRQVKIHGYRVELDELESVDCRVSRFARRGRRDVQKQQIPSITMAGHSLAAISRATDQISLKSK